MTLRTSVRIACRRCRKKRAKCDGQTPCASCEEAGDECEYDAAQRESKSELRAETARLRKSSVDADALICTIASIQDPHLCKLTLQGLVDGRLTRDNILRKYRDHHTSSNNYGTSSHTSLAQGPISNISQQSTLIAAGGFSPEEPPSCFDQLLTWRTCRPNPSSVDAATPPPLSLPPLPLDAYAAHSRKVFFDEARARLFDDSSSVVDLPDIQALGILAQYRLRCGLEAEASELAEAFVARIAEHCQRPLPDDENREDFSKARVITYCSAVSLIRMLSLVTGRLFNTHQPAIPEDLFPLDQLAGSAALADQANHGLRLNLMTEMAPWNVQLVATKLFQLTEWVYNVILAAEADIQAALQDVMEVDERCLGWYKDFFDILAPDGGRTSFVLFVHMYYHFCLLCAFRPFVSPSVDNTDVRPQEICTQAAHSILALAQFYDDLFTFQRVSGFTPYFICVSGLFCLAMEDGGSQVGLLRLRRADGEAAMTDGEFSESDKVRNDARLRDGSLAVQKSHIRLSPAAHACALLSRISSTHPAAMTADKLLKEQLIARFKQRQQEQTRRR
ncbi:hypothetical protein MFIFM68171_02198 [Madurella fahalii]|uniref:Zn(2)-C6 fungal-type domain-containing protein n=1 Tax=Madurella fahalii TaxID=1157608 RepID=A0ABQ0G2K2_9PEZI